MKLAQCGFHKKRGSRETLRFFKRRDFMVSHLKFSVSLEKSSLFSAPLRQLKFDKFSSVLCIFMLFLSKVFQSSLNYASTSNIREVMKFYNRDDQRFETYFDKQLNSISRSWFSKSCKNIQCPIKISYFKSLKFFRTPRPEPPSSLIL